MIKKLTLQDDTRILCGKDYMLALRYVQQTVNQLVDAVNELQLAKDDIFITIRDIQNRITTLDDPTYHEAEPKPSENVQDKFAEQRKWIGCLCRFWDIDNDNLYYGPLTKIHDTSPYCYECNHKMCYANCEPVKDDVIYKGE